MQKPSIASLIGGIVVDAKNLFVQELLVAKEDVRHDIMATKTAVVALGVSIGILAIGVTMILVALVHLLYEAMAWPLWQCYALVGLLVTLLGIAALIFARKKAAEVNFVPERTVEAVKEDAGWIRTHVMPDKAASTRARR
ncbi:MAG TPA: phage holin family protein [Candidatus Acidoferrales bacterium]|nr:phage holin family protein [Candidatus Acidoferrales bacterium]